MILRTTSAELPTAGPAGRMPEVKGCVSVIVPVYNELGHVDELLRAVCNSPVEKHVILVDDGSTDGTRDKLLKLAPALGITLVFHQANQGKGAAIRTGLQYARGEYVLIQDADLEYDPRDYEALLQPLRQGRTNVVYGVRPDRPERGFRYFFGAKLLTHLTNLLYRAGIHDEATCYKVFRRSVLSRINLQCCRFEFCPEVTAKLCREGEAIWDIPISYHPRSKEAGKKIRYRDGWQAIWTLARWRFARRSGWLAPAGENLPPFPVTLEYLPPEQTACCPGESGAETGQSVKAAR